MNPITHLLAGWSIGSLSRSEYRDRWLITTAGVLPDIDGIGIIPELVTKNAKEHLSWWSEYHHVLGHNLIFGIVLSLAGALMARRKRATGLLVFLSFHVHILGDVLGARGPDGYQWPIPYFYPFSSEMRLLWEGQWELNAWQNYLVTGILVAVALYGGWKRGITPLEIVPGRANDSLVETLRRRFGEPAGTAAGQ